MSTLHADFRQVYSLNRRPSMRCLVMLSSRSPLGPSQHSLHTRNSRKFNLCQPSASASRVGPSVEPTVPADSEPFPPPSPTGPAPTCPFFRRSTARLNPSSPSSPSSTSSSSPPSLSSSPVEQSSRCSPAPDSIAAAVAASWLTVASCPAPRQALLAPPRPAVQPLLAPAAQPASFSAPAPASCPVVVARAPAGGATSGTRLPSTHLESSLRALQLLKEQEVNRYAGAPKPGFLALGLTVQTAPLSIRERLSIPEAEWPRAVGELAALPHVQEAAVLSTCNRMELYLLGRSWHRAAREAQDWLCRTSGVPLDELRPYLFVLRDGDAVSHLFRVAGGLDSLVMGEGQILAQVRQVYKVGQNCPGFGRHLNGLFKQAITAGKRVRAETSISTGSVSVSSAAVELAQLKLPTLSWDDAKVCIIGAGKMSTLLVKHLQSKGCKEVTVLNRSLPRAQALAEEFPEVKFNIHLMPDLMACVEASDVIFAASGSEELLLHKEDIARMSAPAEVVGSKRRFIDISVPRNIAPAINELDHAIVYNVDDLKEVVAANKEGRAAAAAEAEVLLREEQRAFEGWRDSLETVPTIKALRSKAEAIRAAEFEKAVSRLGEGLSKKQLKAVEELSKGIVNKLLHGPMSALHCTGGGGEGGGGGCGDAEAASRVAETMRALESMFGLSGVELPEAAGR